MYLGARLVVAVQSLRRRPIPKPAATPPRRGSLARALPSRRIDQAPEPGAPPGADRRRATGSAATAGRGTNVLIVRGRRTLIPGRRVAGGRHHLERAGG
jgi:hypothetical protein